MFMVKGILLLSVSLAIGYVLCILARRESGPLKTLGYTLGIAVITLTLLYGAFESLIRCPRMGNPMCAYKMMKCPGMSHMKGHLK